MVGIGFVPPRPPAARWRPGLRYVAPGLVYGNAATNRPMTSGAPLRAVPLDVDRRTRRLDRIFAQVASAGSTGAVLRFGVYADAEDGVGFYPGRLLLDAGAVSAEAVGVVGPTIDLLLPHTDLVWLACVAQGTPSTVPQILGGNGSHPSIGMDVLGIPGRGCYEVDAPTPGALPDPFPSTFDATGNGIYLGVQVAAVQ